ncbi:MAG TPA: glycosyltransferase [Anaeromyxobacteraceae bacterium]|nr:glycosyltransferase [Anaeromyxobacteraceae bacterium]
MQFPTHPSLRLAGVPCDASFPRTLSTLHWPKRAAWMSRVEVLSHEETGTSAILLRLAMADRYDAIVVDGATGGKVRVADLGAAMLLARRRSGPTVIITDATWSRGSQSFDRLACRIGIRAIDSPRVIYCVLSSDEQRAFANTWKVDPARVVFTPFYFTAGDHDLAAPTREDGSVFAGGDSLRDYRPLLRAARSLQVPVKIAASLERRGLPGNVSAGRVSHARFLELMRNASAVVVPLAARERSAGQQTYLNAMAYGKLVIVPDVAGVRDYIADRKTGIIVPPGDADALASAIDWALDPAHRSDVARISALAKADARRRFSPDVYVERVLEVIRRFARRTPYRTASRA